MFKNYHGNLRKPNSFSVINPEIDTSILEAHLNNIQNWLKLWRIRVNETKFAHITFITRTRSCPPVIFITTVQYHNKRKLSTFASTLQKT